MATTTPPGKMSTTTFYIVAAALVIVMGALGFAVSKFMMHNYDSMKHMMYTAIGALMGGIVAVAIYFFFVKVKDGGRRM